MIAPTFWTRGPGKKLRGNPTAVALVLYLSTSPATNMIGLFYQPLPMICHDLGLRSEDELRALLALPAVKEVVQYDFDAELVWLPEHAREQLGEVIKPADKRRPGIQRELAAFNGHAFATDFVSRYGVAFSLDPKPLPTPIEGAPKGLPRVSEAPVSVSVSSSVSGSADPQESPPSQPNLQARAKLWIDDPNRAAFEAPRPERWPEVLRLGERLADVFGLPVEAPRQPRDPRCLVALQRYAEGYTEAELLEAIEGAKQSRAIGENREYQVLATILRDAAQVDKLRALARPSGTLRKAPSVAERLAADRKWRDADRAARGLPPEPDESELVTDPDEIERICAGIGGAE